MYFKKVFAFCGGFALGQIYYNYLLKDIPFPYNIGSWLSITLSIFLGLCNVVFIQVRCISLLTIPMYCGKAGRGVLKALVLTYVVHGPITNMGLNAKEIVRVFACSTELSYNLTKIKYSLMAEPFRKTISGLKSDIQETSEILRSIERVTAPIESEMEYDGELTRSRALNDYVDELFGTSLRSNHVDIKYRNCQEKDLHLKNYLTKTEYRCNNLLSQTVVRCLKYLDVVYEACSDSVPWHVAQTFCEPLRHLYACNVPHMMDLGICDARKQVDSGLGAGYAALKKVKLEMVKNCDEVKIISNDFIDNELQDVQDAKETGEKVKQAFEKKFSIMQAGIAVVDICMALLFLRIVFAAKNYHDKYLTNIDFDNIYVTEYFKKIDRRRGMKNQYTLLPLKKMERSRYVDVHSLQYRTADRHKLVTRVLKVMLEVITATTFVMLDRLFYEALDVVRRHAELESTEGTTDLNIEVRGTGIVANLLRAMLEQVRRKRRRSVQDGGCLPRPRVMPPSCFVRIYGGYALILVMLGVNPYTLRLGRLISSYFYPRREKQRILHLYNDILKKRIKLQKTLRRKAVQAVRAHFLSGENLLSLRMKFPHVLGWLEVLPAARMTCLICSETKPRTDCNGEWHGCVTRKCPFVYCAECWREIGQKCLACDPSLLELSDIDSLSEEEPKY